MLTQYTIERIENKYEVKAEYLWAKYPTFRVFRNKTNKKWFAVIMEIPQNKLGLKGEETIPVINLKCERDRILMANNVNGVYPAYHMNKEHWITVSLNGSVQKELILCLIEESYNLIAKK